MIGDSVGHYRVEEKLGEGGMGVVYRAYDTHLDRPVAIKVLRPDAVANPERRKRFVQEAKAASALNHPNIITIHDITSENGRDFIVMEYVTGQALDRLIGHRGLPLREALRSAIQIADALAAAHEAGIVHRDLKPGNIMVTDKGHLKLLDFGLAKLTERSETEELAATETLGPRTEEGAIIGTVAYMSPEQAEGKKVDARSDIFSFGSVLYEMVTGRRAFRGETKISTLSSILYQEPPPASEIAAGVPREMERIIARCLRKDPARRLQHMDDVRTLLEELKEESESGQSAIPAPRRRGLRAAAWPAALVILIGITAAAVVWWRSVRGGGRVPTTQPVLTRLTSDAGLAIDPVLSPDGKLVAYASDRGASSGAESSLDIWVQQVATGERLRLTSHEADEREPAFSPDGSRLAYRSEQDGGGVYVVSTLGGEPRRIAKEGRGPRFSPSGEHLAYWTGGLTFQALIQGKVYVTPVGGDQRRQIQPEFHSAACPVWSPDGKHLAFLGVRDAGDPGTLAREMDWWITPLEGDRNAAVKTGVLPALRRRKFAFGGFSGDWVTAAAWLPDRNGDSRLLFSARSGDARNVWHLAISHRTWQPQGEPERLTFGASSERSPSAGVLPGGGTRLVFASLSENLDVWSLPLDANRGVVKGPPQRLTQEEAAEDRPSVSLDGKRVTYLKHAGSASVWWKDLGSGKEALVATSGGNPRISPDGSKVAYVSGTNQLYVVSLSGGDPELVCEDCFIATGWSHDGTRLLDEQVAGQPIGLVTPGQRKRIPIIRHPTYSLSMGRFSPDDRWIAFHAIAGPTGRRVFVAPFRDPLRPGAGPVEEKDWIPVTDGLGMERYAAWSPDGNLLYFLSERDGSRCLRAQRLDPATKRPVGSTMDVQHFHNARRSLLAAGDPVAVNPSIAVDKVVFSLLETTGNIWMTEFEAASR